MTILKAIEATQGSASASLEIGAAQTMTAIRGDPRCASVPQLNSTMVFPGILPSRGCAINDFHTRRIQAVHGHDPLSFPADAIVSGVEPGARLGGSSSRIGFREITEAPVPEIDRACSSVTCRGGGAPTLARTRAARRPLRTGHHRPHGTRQAARLTRRRWLSPHRRYAPMTRRPTLRR
jgi:hypothetical protein